jgi:hypothetical protein
MRLLSLLVLGAALLLGQAMTLTVGQLKAFLRSSVQLHHQDNKVADYVKKMKLTERLTARDVEELVGEGVGPKTAAALNDLVSETATAPVPARDSAAAAQSTGPTLPMPSSEEQKQIIGQAREVALEYSRRLPDFICMRVTRRYYDPAGLETYHLADTLAMRLSYFEQKENYKLISVNNQYVDTPYEKLGGTTSSGEFGTMLKEIFEPSTETEFWWERWAKLRGRIVHVFGYRVRQDKSKWHITWQRELDTVPAYKGLIYIDRDVPVIYRVTLVAENLPASFPIQEAESQLDYDYTDIAGNSFLLPLRAQVRMREGKLLVKNLDEFRNYRKFGAEATVTFDVPDALPDDKFKEEKPPGKQ